ncbi:MAG: ABC transporter permease [Armatimonadota bacterium]
MSEWTLALNYLATRRVVTLVTILSVALGLGLATVVLILSRSTRETLQQETAYWDVIVGAKGSGLQLVLNGLYYLDAPVGNINTHVWEHLKGHPSVKAVVPITMGDNYFGVPIVGTTHDFFTDRTARNGRPILADGQYFARPMEVVIGADVARRQHLALGDKIVGSHGWGAGGAAHADQPYTVVGMLASTGSSLDRAIYTEYRSVWEIHQHHHHQEGHGHNAAAKHHDEAHGEAHTQTQEVTSLLVRLTKPGRRYQFVEEVNADLPAMAAVPVDEINKVTVTFLNPMQNIMLAIAYLVAIVSALGILATLYLTIHQRRRDIAILRSLGATQGDIFRLITIEAAIIAGVGVLVGGLLGHGALAACASYCVREFGVAPAAWEFTPVEGLIAVSIWGLGILAGLLPAVLAYRVPVVEMEQTEA